ncbi:DNA adenine methylase [Thiomicrorhabdus hydrogeniphila]
MLARKEMEDTSRKKAKAKVLDFKEKLPKPFIKWVGGKRQLLPELHKRLPTKVDSYFEPFIGGGALMWSLDRSKIQRIVINDYNPELANLYQVVKDSPDALLKNLSKHRNTETYYYQMREMDRFESYSRRTSITKASRFIYLNKTGFNGLYRVNSSGQNNVPFGRYSNPCIVETDNIYACSSFLQGVEILNGDFELIRPMLDENSFVYLDPPYAPLSATSSFTGYTDKGFNDDMQLRLKEFCDYINSIGAKFMLSNSSAPLIYDLYSDYQIDEVLANRAVNCKASGRGKVTELVIRNYG